MALGLIQMKFSMHIRVLQRMNPNDFGNPLTCLNTSDISQHVRDWNNILHRYSWFPEDES